MIFSKLKKNKSLLIVFLSLFIVISPIIIITIKEELAINFPNHRYDHLSFCVPKTHCHDYNNEKDCLDNSGYQKFCYWTESNECKETENNCPNEEECRIYINYNLRCSHLSGLSKETCESNSLCKWQPPLRCAIKGNCVSY